MNKVILMGRLTGDPEVRYGTGERNMAVGRYTLAVDRRYKRDGEQQADFIRCVTFDKAAEFAEKYFRKGMRVCVSGRIQTGSYVNKDGQKVYTTEVVVDDQEFADSKNQGGDNGSFGGGSYGGGQGYGGGYGNNQNYSAGQSQGGSYQQGTRPAPSAAIGDGFMNIPDGVEDEGLPFN